MRWLFLVILSFSASQTVALAQHDVTIAEIRAKAKAAQGVRPPSEVVTTSVVRSGLTGTEVRERSGDDYRIDTTLGPIHTAEGSAGGVFWRQNSNGETVVTDGTLDGDDEPDEHVVSTVRHVTEPSDLYVIAKLDELGRGTREYYDPETWHLVRFDRIGSNETTTTTYADFRTVGGYTRAWRVATADGHPENDRTDTITADDIRPVPTSDLAVPPDRRTLVEFPPGETTVKLPAQLDRADSKFIVRLSVGGRGLDFLLDSGASGITIDRDLARSMGFGEFDAFSNAENAGRYVETTTIVPKIAIGDITMHDVVVGTTPNLGIDHDGFKVVGLLGFDFLRGASVKLDYVNETAIAYTPASFVPPSAGADTIALGVGLDSYVPETAISINGSTGKHFIIDTGGAGALMIFDDFRRRFPDAVVDERHARQSQEFGGIGGYFDTKAMILTQYKIGTANFTHSGAYVIDSSKLYNGADGIVGPEILRIFVVYLDLAHGKVYLVPNSDT
jgi:predicted aspartyl protease